jgi:hypothetical protein
VTVGDDVLWCYFQGPVYFQLWKVRLCHMRNNNKIGKKSGKKKRGMVLSVGDNVLGCCFQGPVCISKYGK